MIFQKRKLNNDSHIVYQEVPFSDDEKGYSPRNRILFPEEFESYPQDPSLFSPESFLSPEEPDHNTEEAELTVEKPEQIVVEQNLTSRDRRVIQEPSHHGTGNRELDLVIERAGYAYDPDQDIFYSIMNPWQRNVGYCRLYDELAAPLGMIMDCEPIFFDYDNRKWMISFWKGQYDLVTGGEIGVYTGGLRLHIPGFFNGTFYNAVKDNECLNMSYTLRKNGRKMFTREGKHWWLTGFKLGEFSEPSELTMDVSVTFKDGLMRDAFLTGFRKAGYKPNEYTVFGNTVSFVFGTPRTRQPFTRTKDTDKLIQAKNKLLCELYQEMTASGDNILEKFQAIEEQAPDLYAKVMRFGTNKKAYEAFYIVIMIFMYMLSAFMSGSKKGKTLSFLKKIESLKSKSKMIRK